MNHLQFPVVASLGAPGPVLKILNSFLPKETMSRKRRKLQKHSEKNSSEDANSVDSVDKGSFRTELKKFLEVHSTTNAVTTIRYLETQVSIHGRKLDAYSIQRFINKEKFDTLKRFYKEYFDKECELSKKQLVRLLVEMFQGKESKLDIRNQELENIDEGYINEATTIFTLSGVGVHRDVMLEILSFLRCSHKLLYTVGSVNSSFYLLILTNWSSIVPVSHQSLYSISALVLKSMRRFILGQRFTKKEFDYLFSNVSTAQIREIFIYRECSGPDIQKFFNYLKKKKIVFPNCQLLGFPTMFLDYARSKKDIKENKRQIEIPPLPFPNLRTIYNFQPNNFSAKQLGTLRSIEFGVAIRESERRISHDCVIIPELAYRDQLFNTTYREAGISHHIYNVQRHMNAIKVPLKTKIFETSRIVDAVIRIWGFNEGCRSCLTGLKQLKNLRTLEIHGAFTGWRDPSQDHTMDLSSLPKLEVLKMHTMLDTLKMEEANVPPNLKKFICSNLDEEVIRTILNHCKALEVAKIRSIEVEEDIMDLLFDEGCKLKVSHLDLPKIEMEANYERRVLKVRSNVKRFEGDDKKLDGVNYMGIEIRKYAGKVSSNRLWDRARNLVLRNPCPFDMIRFNCAARYSHYVGYTLNVPTDIDKTFFDEEVLKALKPSFEETHSSTCCREFCRKTLKK